MGAISQPVSFWPASDQLGCAKLNAGEFCSGVAIMGEIDEFLLVIKRKMFAICIHSYGAIGALVRW
jgi:hypothetical protein